MQSIKITGTIQGFDPPQFKQELVGIVIPFLKYHPTQDLYEVDKNTLVEALTEAGKLFSVQYLTGFTAKCPFVFWGRFCELVPEPLRAAS